MAQINLTLNQKEILEVITGDREEALKFLLEKILNEIMKAESEEQLGARAHERTPDRRDYRNGSRERQLTTRIGTLTPQVPRHRNEPFHTMVFENHQRSEASLIATMAQMVVAGVSTRKVSKVVETLRGESYSKSTVSKLRERLDKEVTEFTKAPLDGVDAPFLMVDATCFKVRENHRIVAKAFMVALAIKSDGHREVVGFAVHDGENDRSWKAFFEDLKARGLESVRLVTSDAHKSIREAMAEVYPKAAWQRCQAHFQRNVLNETSAKHKEGLRVELREMFTAKTVEEARKKKEEILKDYEPVAEKAMETPRAGFQDCVTVMNLPEYMRIVTRTSNLLERLNRELKRRAEVIQVFPNEASVRRLMGTVTMEHSEAQSATQRIFSEKKFEEIRKKVEAEYERVANDQIRLLKTV